MKENNSKGFIAISSVVIILAVILGLTLVMSYNAIGEAQSGLAVYQGEQNFHGAEGCVEDVMLKIRSNSTYNSTSFTRPEGSCTIFYNAGGGGPINWDLTVTFQSVVSTAMTRRINVLFTRGTSGITLTSWNEI